MELLAIARRSPVVLALVCLAVAALIFVSEGSYWRSVGTLNELGSIGAARLQLQTLAQGVLDAESGQRGYLLTDRREYLAPYARALTSIDEAFKVLIPYYSQEPQSKQDIAQLRVLTDTKLSELAETMRLHDEGKNDSATALVLSDIGKEKMEAIRQLSAKLLARENANVAEGRGDIYHTLTLSRIGIAALSAMGLLTLFMYLRQSAALERQRLEQQRLVQAERDRLEAEVSQRTAQLTELTDHLQTAREDERHRLARNLHDELGALLTSAKLDAARIRSRLVGTAPEALERLNHLVGTLNSSIALGRRIIEDLRPSALGNLGLVATLEILARDFAEHSGVQVYCALEPVTLEPDAELVVYRVVQEAITNLTKYAKARQVWLNLSSQDRQVTVSIRDDGVGFDPSAKPTSAYGLVGMRFRVAAEGGTLNVKSAPGLGTTIEVRLPETAPNETVPNLG